MTSRYDSEWYQSVNDGSQFELLRGVAKTRLDAESVTVELYTRDGALHATFEGTVDEESGKIIGAARAANGDGPETALRGYFFQRDEDDLPELRLDQDVSILVTDGWTTLGVSLPGRR